MIRFLIAGYYLWRISRAGVHVIMYDSRVWDAGAGWIVTVDKRPTFALTPNAAARRAYEAMRGTASDT